MDRSCQQYFDAFSQTSDGEIRSEYYNPFAVRHRKKTTRQQLEVLERTFETNIRPDTQMRKMLAEQLGMTPRSIQVWFQNRRAKEKKMADKCIKHNGFYDDIACNTSDTYVSAAQFCFSATNNNLFEMPVMMCTDSGRCSNLFPQSGSLGICTSLESNLFENHTAMDPAHILFDTGIAPCFERGAFRCE
eukprot:jgi/Antlo1/562/2325